MLKLLTFSTISISSVSSVSALSFFKNNKRQYQKLRKGDPEPWACYMDAADQYMGTVQVANSGQKCYQWSDAQAHPDLGGNFFLGLTKGETSGNKLEGNFCRAFAGDAKPWCFVKGFKTPADAKQECDVPQCPTDGPWSRDFKDESKDTIKCSDMEGAPASNCDCSCAGVKGKALIQLPNGDKGYCHCSE